MNFYDINERHDKFVYVVITVFLLSLAHSEALKSTSIVIMLLLFLYDMFSKRVTITKDAINLLIVLHFLLVVLGIWVGINSAESLSQSSDVLKILLVFLFFREMNLGFININKILNFLFIGFVFAIIFGLYAYYFQGMDFLKLKSVGSINRSAIYTMLVFLLSLSFASYNFKELSFKSSIVVLTVVLSFVGVILAGSRTALFSLPLLLLLFLYLKNKITTIHVALIVVLLILFVFIVPEFFPDTRLSSKILIGFSDPARMQIWEGFIRYYMEHNILFGIGVGNSIFIDLTNYFGNDTLVNFRSTHHLYLDILLERGVLGLATFLLFIGFVVKNSYKKINQHPIYLAVVLMTVSILLMGLANVTFKYEFGLLLVCIIGISLNKSLKPINKVCKI